jgi:murein tripeptide amidase MpaA
VTPAALVRASVLAALALAASSPAPARGDEEAARAVRFDRYYDVEQMEAVLRTFAEAFPDRTRLESMGRSREGRELWVMTVFAPGGGEPGDEPAFYVDGNTHGNEVQATEVCLFTLQYLLTKDDPWVRALLERVTFHVAPCVNPDARHRFFHTPTTEHSPRGVLRPVDDDRDGTADEDGPDDLDGDGEILSMRVLDPEGDFVADERDDRLMRRRRPGERGRWRMLGLEGTDEDGDGRLNEDGIGAVDPNRNWPSQWRTEDEQHGAGPYPLSEPETRATALWMLEHPRIAGVQSYHNAGAMILRPPAAWTDREFDMPAGDRATYDEIARRGLQVLPDYRYLQIREGLYRVFGGFVDWTYVDLGLFSFTNELWGNPVEATGADRELRLLQWNDVALHGRGFVRWTPVAHPALGTVEVGGWRRFTLRSDPPDFLHDTCVRNCLFTLEHAAMLPHLVLDAPAFDASARTLRVRVENRAPLPTIGELARRNGVLPPDRVRVEGARVLGAVRERPGETPEVLDVRAGAAELPDGVPGDGSVTVRLWLDAAPSAVEVDSRLGGRRRADVR